MGHVPIRVAFVKVAFAAAPLNVVVTVPVLKDFAEQVGGRHVRVRSLLRGTENEHTYSPKPSDLIAVRNADVFIEIGMGLEVWVEALVRNAGNTRMLRVTASEGLGRLDGETPDRRRRSSGNPHVWLDPENAKVMVTRIAEAFARVDPTHAHDYRTNQVRYLRDIDTVASELVARVQRLRDRRIVVHHPAWPYFARRFGLEIAGEIVTQSGAEPSAHHLKALMTRIREAGIRVIVSEPQLNQKLAHMLAVESGARVAVLTAMPGGLPGTDTYLEMLRYNVAALEQALGGS
jgi:zinc/manganese transport system substrate-binding protein/zinc transport system substrate-binding protein/manganese/iron transport system substrate-binding protein